MNSRIVLSVGLHGKFLHSLFILSLSDDSSPFVTFGLCQPNGPFHLNLEPPTIDFACFASISSRPRLVLAWHGVHSCSLETPTHSRRYQSKSLGIFGNLDLVNQHFYVFIHFAFLFFSPRMSAMQKKVQRAFEHATTQRDVWDRARSTQFCACFDAFVGIP